MFIKLFQDIQTSTNNKIRNPFFGTYIIVWFIRNWELIYSLFYFDESLSLAGRLEYIKNYFEQKGLILGLLNNLWITFLIFTISYVLLNLSRFIINFSEWVVKPSIDKMIDTKNVVTKDRFIQMESQRNDLQNSIDAIRTSLSKSELEVMDRDKKLYLF